MEQIPGQMSFLIDKPSIEPKLKRFVFYLCDECGMYADMAGFCDFCHTRLQFHTAVPVERILRIRDELAEPISVDEFVDLLMAY